MKTKNLAHIFTVLSFALMFLGGLFFGITIGRNFNSYEKKIKSLKMFELEGSIYRCLKVEND